MKIYTVTKKSKIGINVGMVLVNNYEEVCFDSHFNVTSDLETEGHLMGINRALSVIKNREKYQECKDIICVLPDDLKGWIDLRIREDRYMQHFRRMLNINIVTKGVSNNDQKFINLAKQKCDLIKQISKNNGGR